MAFCTQYDHYEYLIMPFELTNVPAMFQHYINKVLKDLLDICIIIYLDDILVYSRDLDEHKRHVHNVLSRLHQYKLYAKLLKCKFHCHKVKYLGFILGKDGVHLDPSQVEMISDWLEPKSFKDVQVFLGLTGYFCWFIHKYTHITTPLTNLLRGMKYEKKLNLFNFLLTMCEAFEALKLAFTEPPVLIHFDLAKPILLCMDALK